MATQHLLQNHIAKIGQCLSHLKQSYLKNYPNMKFPKPLPLCWLVICKRSQSGYDALFPLILKPKLYPKSFKHKLLIRHAIRGPRRLI